MSEETIKKIEESLERIENKTNKFMFFVPDSEKPTASVYEVYFHATTMKKAGYEVIMITESKDYEVPTWIESELLDHEFIAITNTGKLKISPDDVMVIPDVFTNVMEQLKQVPCIKIALLQSIDYMANGLVPGTSFAVLGVQNVIATSKTLKEHFEMFYGENIYDIKDYKLGIPSYFFRSDVPQKPVISIIGRNGNDISKVVKLFYSRYPHFNWITFDPMYTESKPPQHLSRPEFAKSLQGNFAAIWIDRLASFGTFPVECMKTGTVPICLKPDITPEYLLVRDENDNIVDVNSECGVWTGNLYDIPILAGEVVTKYLDDSIEPVLYEVMDKVASEYTQEKSSVEIANIYAHFINKKAEKFKELVVELKAKENE